MFRNSSGCETIRLSGGEQDILEINCNWQEGRELRCFELRTLHIYSDIVSLKADIDPYTTLCTMKSSKLLNVIQTISQFCDILEIEVNNVSIIFQGSDSFICKLAIELKQPEVNIITTSKAQKQTIRIKQLLTICKGGSTLSNNVKLEISTGLPLNLHYVQPDFGSVNYVIAEAITGI